MSSSPSYPLHRRDIRYGNEHSLQTLDIFIPAALDASTDRTSKVWLIFIHGGAWCDPTQNSRELQPALDQLHPSRADSAHSDGRSVAAPHHRIAAYASLNYGLSPRPGEFTLDPARNREHPQHLRDVLAALRFLRREYGVGARDGWAFVAMGHSCGATMVFQLAMGLLPREQGGESGFGVDVAKPVALVGLEGLYDLPLMVENHEDVPYYAAFVASAFGYDEKLWKRVSPVSADVSKIWKDTKCVVLGMSEEDELVEWEQVEVMYRHVNSSAAMEKDQTCKLVKLTGKHDECWSKGDGIIKALKTTLAAIFTPLSGEIDTADV